MAIPRFSCLLICLIASFSLLSAQLEAIHYKHGGFTTNLIHRDSPLSPSYNPSLTKWDRLRSSIHRSKSRLSLFGHDDFQSSVVSANGAYIMEVSLGTPPVSQYAIADTGSDLIWMQCQPCLHCYKQDQPIFNPKKSSSYQLESCDSNACQALADRGTCSQKNMCTYTYSYGDQSSTEGDVATETLTFGTTKGNVSSFPEVSFGCGHNNQGTFGSEGSGLIGLGGGPLSLVSQLTSTVGGKFSYCLVPFDLDGNFSSKISFGQEAEVSGEDVVSTPILKKSPKTFYFLTLEGLTVGDDNNTFVSFKSSSTNDFSGSKAVEGNIVIDSGTTLTMLPTDIFSELSSAMAQAIKGKQVEDPSGVLQLCYQSNGEDDLIIPTVTAHFIDANIELTSVNTFIKVAEDVICLAIVSSEQLGIAIWGNIAQSNFLVGYDLQAGKVSFKPTDCSKD